jgi:hypothetical protein
VNFDELIGKILSDPLRFPDGRTETQILEALTRNDCTNGFQFEPEPQTGQFYATVNYEKRVLKLGDTHLFLFNAPGREEFDAHVEISLYSDGAIEQFYFAAALPKPPALCALSFCDMTPEILASTRAEDFMNASEFEAFLGSQTYDAAKNMTVIEVD